MATATRNRKSKEAEGNSSGSATRVTRVTHAVPTMGKVVKINDVTFRPTSKNTKYTEIVMAIRALKLRQGITFEPVDGESVEALKLRISSLVSRSCSKAAAPGTKFRTKITEDGEVCVYLDERKVTDEDA